MRGPRPVRSSEEQCDQHRAIRPSACLASASWDPLGDLQNAANRSPAQKLNSFIYAECGYHDASPPWFDDDPFVVAANPHSEDVFMHRMGKPMQPLFLQARN